MGEQGKEKSFYCAGGAATKLKHTNWNTYDYTRTARKEKRKRKKEERIKKYSAKQGVREIEGKGRGKLKGPRGVPDARATGQTRCPTAPGRKGRASEVNGRRGR